MKKYIIFLLVAIFSLPFADATYATSSTGSTVKTSIKKKVVVKKVVKKFVKKVKTPVASTGSVVKTENIITLNKPFTIGDVEYTILSIHMFDKVGYQNQFSDFIIPKNGKFMMVEFTYKNLSEEDENTTGMMKVIDGDRMYETSSEGKVYGATQMNWDESLKSDNWAGYLPPGIKKNVFISFDVPESTLESGALYIDGGYMKAKKVTMKIPLKNLK